MALPSAGRDGRPSSTVLAASCEPQTPRPGGGPASASAPPRRSSAPGGARQKASICTFVPHMKVWSLELLRCAATLQLLAVCMVASRPVCTAACPRERGRSGGASGGLGGGGGSGESELNLQRQRIGSRRKALQRRLAEVRHSGIPQRTPSSSADVLLVRVMERGCQCTQGAADTAHPASTAAAVRQADDRRPRLHERRQDKSGGASS